MKQNSPLWYTAAFLFALASLMAAAAVASGAWAPVRDATVLSIPTRVDAADQTVAVFTDTLQPDRDITCTATHADKSVTHILKPGLKITVTSGSEQWHLIALLRDGSDGLKIACTPRDKRHDDANYGYAGVTGYASRVNAGKGIAILGLTISVGVAGWTYYGRRRQRLDAAAEATENPTQ